MKLNYLISIFICLSFSMGLFQMNVRAEIDIENVVGAWLFDEGKGTVAEDISGNELNGTLQGKLNWVNGKFGKALEFNGTDAFIEVPAHENPREQITISLWVKSNTDTWNAHGWFVEKRNAYVLHPNQDTKNVAWALCNGGCWNKPGGWSDGAVGPADITEWHMYTTTYNSDTGKWIIYIDGKEESEMDLNKTPLDADSGPVFIGKDSCCAGRFGNALIDEVAIFNVALEPDDISTLMKRGLAPTLTSVEAEGKMATKWGKIKVKY